MTPRMTAALGGLALLAWHAGPARALETGAPDTGVIATGAPGSAAQRVGRDIADLAWRFGAALTAEPSRGALQNLRDLTRRPGVVLAVVPSDLLDFLASAADDPELRRTRDALRVVFPLYREEVHVLARPGIATFADLAGRRVAVGDPDSGTLVTATLLLATAGVRPKEELRLGGEEALDAVRGGRADAMVEVEARPAAPLRDRVAVEDALHLVPVDLPALRGLYPAAAIPAGTYYPWQPEEVPTVAPRAVLVTLDWAGMEGREGTCRLVGKVARVVADNLERLRRAGDPAWRGVDLAARLPGWERSSCVEEALAGAGGLRPQGAGGATPLGRGAARARGGAAGAEGSRPVRRGAAELRGGGRPGPAAAVRGPPAARAAAVRMAGPARGATARAPATAAWRRPSARARARGGSAARPRPGGRG